MIDYQQMKSVIEGLLFVSGDEGIEAKQIAAILDIDVATVIDLIADMQADFTRGERGIRIVEVAQAYQLTTLPEHAPYFERLAYSPTHSTLSQASLETLAIIAYRQPITRLDVEEIRGVKCEKAIQTLVAKGLVQEVGRAEAMGRPIIYGTTKEFLEYFGLSSLDELPDPPAFVDPQELEEETQLLFQKLDSQMTLTDVGQTKE